MRVDKKILAAAVLAALGGAAHAEVVMYGMAMPFVEDVKTTGATQGVPADKPNMVPAAYYSGVNDPMRSRITVGTSHWGFRGSEQLDGSLKVVWQLESAFQIDQNTGPGWGARDSKVGLSDKWGEIFLGQWDTPYKYISLAVNPLRAGYTFDRTPITGNPGLQVPNTTTQFTRSGAKPDASFDRRQGNSVQYWSPNFAGFSFRADYSVNEGKGTVVSNGPVINPTLEAFSLQYDHGPLSVRYAYEQHNDYFGMAQIGGSAAGTATNPSSRDRAHKLVVLWLIGNTRLTGMFEQLDYHTDDSVAGAVNKYKRNAWYGVIEQRFANGSQSVWVGYGRAADGSCERVGGASCSTRDIGADYVNLGYIYRFSKRTEGFIAYYRVNNKANATYTVGPMVGSSIAAGADTVGFGAGLQHFF